MARLRSKTEGRRGGGARRKKHKPGARHDAVLRPKHGDGIDLVAKDGENTDFDNSSAQHAVNIFTGKKKRKRGDADETSDQDSDDNTSFESDGQKRSGAKLRRTIENQRVVGGGKRGRAKSKD